MVVRNSTRLVAPPLAAALVAVTTASAQTWRVLDYDGAGRRVAPYLSSLGGGERGMGAVRSAAFVLDSDVVTLEICGHDGPPGQRRQKNWFALCDAQTGLALRRTPPPGQDAMTPVRWDVVEFMGRTVYLRAVDALDESAFAWQGWQNVRVGDRELLGPLTSGELPTGWTEETPPQGLSRDQWLACPLASAQWAVEEVSAQPTWGVLTINGELRQTAPYLSSLRGGEQGTGAVRSPAFVLDVPTYTFLGMGADSPTGDAGLNSFQLVDADTLEILRRAEPPVGNTLLPVTWDTAELVGRRVFFRAVDGNDGPGWAWLGCDRVPLGAGRLAVFADPNATIGWREEGQPEGTLGPGAGQAKPLREMVEEEWRAEDFRRGIRWGLWASNPRAAPVLARRLARLMAEDFDRADSLFRDFVEAGVPGEHLADLRDRMSDLRQRLAELQEGSGDLRSWQDLRLEQRWALRELAFQNPALNFDRLLFVKRFTQRSYADINVNHHAWGSRPGGDICVLEGLHTAASSRSAEPQVTTLLNGRLGPGNVHGIDLDWDAERVVFAWARSASGQPPEGWLSRQATFDLHRTVDLLHLYELRLGDGQIRQLTTGQWSDLNPCYLPNGDIAFESERCAYELNCNELDKDEPTTNLFVMHADGTNIRRLTVTKDGDWYPRVLNDGSIIYSHWEYHERGLAYMHPLWFVRPDGTGADAFAKQHFDFPVTLTVPRPLPNSHRLIAIASGHHTLAAGPVVLVDRHLGPNDPACLVRITGPDVWPEYGGAAPPPNCPGWRLPPGQGWYMDPYPLTATTYLAAYCDGAMQDEAGYALYLLDVYGGKELIYRDPTISSVMPIPLRPRSRPPTMPPLLTTSEDATCVVWNVAEGVPEFSPGLVKALRIAEPVPWPFSNETGGQRYEPDAKATGVSWTPIRIFGTVPVEPDGSAYFRVPAERELYFQALDAEGRELRRMRSYISFRPGEVRGCTGCHETRPQAPSMRRSHAAALRRPASVPVPPPWGLAPLSFLRDIQPLLTSNCVRCHSGLRPAGGLDLSPGLTRDHNCAYDTLADPARGLLALSNKGDNSRVTGVMEFGSHRSRLVEVLRTTHRDRCSLSKDDWQRLYTWVDANAVYHDDFIRKRPASEMSYSLAEDHDLWQRLDGLHERRCAGCHAVASLSRPEWVDLFDPQRSLVLAAPLAGGATPSGRVCAKPTYADVTDPDYVTALTLLREAAARSWQHPRRELRCLAGDTNLRACLSFWPLALRVERAAR